MERSRKLTLTDWTVANNALNLRFGGNKSELARHVGMSRTTITNFFKEKSVGQVSFEKICRALRLNWQQVSSIDLTLDSSKDESSGSMPFDEISIEQVREHCRQKILNRHSQMRLLSGKEIGVDQLYVDVWLLEKPEREHFIDDAKTLLQNFDIENDRLALSKRIQRNPGFKIASSESKLIILGKPGSGKTTFLKHLGIDWCKGKFQPEKIAVLVELRQIRSQTWKLVNAITQELGEIFREFALEKQKDILTWLLKQGKLLVLMDGLDEVPTDELRQSVQAQVKQISETYSKDNRFILTCRTQIIGEIPSGFSSVEVADFSVKQVRQFVQNWFIANGQSESVAIQQWQKIQSITTNQPDLRELTATPVLLSLICVVWQDSGEIPANRTNLYKRGINWLLSRWNNQKEIEGWKVGTKAYRQLSIEDKKALLIEIAARKFESPRNFVLFEQDELVEQISRKLHLPNVREGIDVLQAIETQHGLLVERADELWSFSHLTFQEYFTIQYLTQLSPEQLAKKISNQQWQRIVEQLVKSQQPSDRLLRLIKQAIDKSMIQEPVMQTFLDWLLQKSSSLRNNYKPAAIRAFYYSLTLDPDLARAHTLYLARALDQRIDHALKLDRALYRAYSRADYRSRRLDPTLDPTLYYVINLDRTLDRTLDRAINRALALDLSPLLISCLRQLKNKLPTSNHLKELENWWSSNGIQWIAQLRQVMIGYRNIGHDWQFSKEQKQKLQRYREANKFLVNLMKINGAVSEECCTEIEDGLLLPWAELQCRQPHLYGELKVSNDD